MHKLIVFRQLYIMSVFDDDNFFIDQFDEEDLEMDDLLYQSNRLDNCILEEFEFNSFYDGPFDQSQWKDHTTKECIISFNGSKKRVWREAQVEISDIKKNLYRKLKIDENEAIKKSGVVSFFTGKFISIFPLQ